MIRQKKRRPYRPASAIRVSLAGLHPSIDRRDEFVAVMMAKGEISWHSISANHDVTHRNIDAAFMSTRLVVAFAHLAI